MNRLTVILLAFGVFWSGTAFGQETKQRLDRYGELLPAGASARLGMLSRVNETGGSVHVQPAFSPDGKVLATVNGSQILLWDVASGRVVQRLPGHKHEVLALAFRPDGLLASVGQDEKVRLWDRASGKERRSFSVPRNWVGIAFARDGKLLATTVAYPPGPNRIHVWDVDTGKELFQTVEHYPQVFFSRDGRLLLSSWWDRNKGQTTSYVTVRESRTGKVVRKTRLPGGTLVTDISPNGQWLAGHAFFFAPVQTDWYSLLQLYDLETGEVVRTFGKLPSGDLKRVAFSPDGKLLASISKNLRVGVWDVTTGKQQAAFTTDENFFNHVAFSPDSQLLANAPGNARVFLYDVRRGTERCLNPGHRYTITTLAFAADGKHLASGGDDSQVLLWDLATGLVPSRLQLKVQQLPMPSEFPSALAFAPDGKFLLVQKNGRDVALFNLAHGREVVPFRDIGWVYGFTPDGRSLLWSGKKLAAVPRFGPNVQSHAGSLKDPEVWWQIWQLVNTARAHPELGQFRFVPYVNNDPPTPPAKLALAGFDTPNVPPLREPNCLSADGSILVENVLRLAGNPMTNMGTFWSWSAYRFSDARTGRLIGTFPTSRAGLGSQSFAPDGRTFAASDAAAFRLQKKIGLALWETESRQVRLTLNPALDTSASLVAFSPDGRWFAFGEEQGQIAVVDLTAGKIVQRLKAEYPPKCLLFAPDSRTLASAQATNILLWDVAFFPQGTADKQPLAKKELDKLWAELANADAARAYQAMLRLQAQPKATVSLLRQHLLVPGLARSVAGWIDDLDKDQFAVRERATRALEEIGEPARPLLHQALARTTSLEQRMRIERMLEKFGPPFSTPESLRLLRAVEVLEHIGTPAARDVLRALAGTGAAGDPLTVEVRRSLERLTKRLSQQR